MTRSSQKSDRVLGCLLGGALGMLFSCCLGIAALALGGSPPTIPAAPPPPAYDIEAIVEEDYINRTFLESAAGLPTPLPLVAGHLDVHPGGQADFATQVALGPLRPVFRGTVALRATPAGELRVDLIEVRAGSVPVTALVPASLARAINQAVNQQVAERAGAAGVRVIGVTSDETTLRFYLASAP